MTLDPTRCEYHPDCKSYGDHKVFIKPEVRRGYWIMCKEHADKVMA